MGVFDDVPRDIMNLVNALYDYLKEKTDRVEVTRVSDSVASAVKVSFYVDRVSSSFGDISIYVEPSTMANIVIRRRGDEFSFTFGTREYLIKAVNVAVECEASEATIIIIDKVVSGGGKENSNS